MDPMQLTQTELAKAMGVPRRLVNELCRDRRSVTVQTALILARVFGNAADFWLNVQKRNDLWIAMNSRDVARRLSKVKPLTRAT